MTSPPSREPLAIVGIGCRFPGEVGTPEAFWKLLWEGIDAITEVSPERWRARAYPNPCSRGGFLTSVDRFDPLFFGISPREAVAIDPQQRLLLELAWEAFADAGIVAEHLSGSRIGVFIGLSSYDHGIIQHQRSERSPINPYLMLGTTLSIAANRISYTYDLRGPSLVVDTACSSSLTALHLACKSIWSGESNLALVGGTNLLLQPTISASFADANMLSPEGLCKSFDADANGYVRGEGGGVIVLKPLGQALEDNDRIYALVLGTAVNQEGHTPGISVPNGDAQQALLREAYRDAKIAPADVQYVEAHGTGTPVGDPIEASALGTVLAEGRSPDGFCWVGSVKTNIGHLEAGAGIAGIIKTALSLYHRKIAPNLHFKIPNPKIDFDRLRLKVPTTPLKWPDNGQLPRLAGVNSFGFGGANAHAVLASFEDKKYLTLARRASEGEDIPRSRVGLTEPCQREDIPRSRVRLTEPCQLLPLSAHTPEALLALTDAFLEWLSAHPDTVMPDLAYTMGLRRAHHLHRLAVVADSPRQVVDRLRALRINDLAQPPSLGISAGRIYPNPQGVFVFSGMGPQWWGMGRELLAQEPVFRETMVECERLLRRLADWSLLEELAVTEEYSRIDEPGICQPALFALQTSLAALWRSWGIVPAAVTGHSVGEIAAAHVAGILSLPDAIEVVFHRSRLQQHLRGKGKMLAVSLSAAEAERLVTQSVSRSPQAHVCVAAINSPTAVTLSGDAEVLEAIAGELERKGVFCRFLRVDVPYHSSLMDPLWDELLRSLQGIRPRQPEVPFFSTVTGQRVSGPDLDAAYWWDNVRQPVGFTRSIGALLVAGHETFLEVGPHPVLGSYIRECAEAASRSTTMLSSLRRQEPERPGMLQTLGQLYVRGFPINWERVQCGSTMGQRHGGNLVTLPPYPWQRERYWRESDTSRQVRMGHVQSIGSGLLGKEEHPLLGRPIHSATATATSTRTWHVDLDLQGDHLWLTNHCIQGAVVFPAAGYIETALAAFRTLGQTRISLESLEFHRPLNLIADRTEALELVVEDDLDNFTFFSQESDGSWARLATGKAGRPPREPLPGLQLDEVRRRCPREIGQEQWYEQLHEAGYHYGPSFQGVRNVWCGDGEALALLRLPEPLAESAFDFGFHPAIIDSCLQVCQGMLPVSSVHVPRRAEQVTCHQTLAESGWNLGRPLSLYCHVQHAPRAQKGYCDIRLVDGEGHALLEILGFQSVSIGRKPDDDSECLDNCFHESRWLLQPLGGRFTDGMPSVGRLLEEIQPDMERLRVEQSSFDQGVKPRLDALCVGFIVDALRALGWRFQSADRLSTDVLADELGVVSGQRLLFARLLEILALVGIVRSTNGCWESCEDLPVCHPGPDVAWREMLREFPGYLAELALLGLHGANLADVLRGQVDSPPLFDPNGIPSPLLEQFAHSAPSTRFVNGAVQAALVAVLRLLPTERPLRILELGSSGLTSVLLPLLPRHRTAYFLADPSPGVLAQAEQRFQSFPFVQYLKLDPEQGVRPEELPPHSVDVVLAVNPLRFPDDLSQILPRICKWLIPGGLLIRVPPTRKDPFWTLVFGAVSERPSPKESSLLRGDWLPEASYLTDSDKDDPRRMVYFARTSSDVEGEDFVSSSFSISLSTMDPPAAPPGCWILFADGGSVASELRAMLENRGERVIQTPASQPQDMVRLLQECSGGRIRLRGIVHLGSLDANIPGENFPRWPEDAHQLGWPSVLFLVQAWAGVESVERPRLYLVTRAAQLVRRGEAPGVIQSTLWGMGRTIRSEHPELRCTLIDLAPNGFPQEVRSLFDELMGDDIEDEIALRENDRFIHRLLPVTPAELFNPDTPEEVVPEPFRIDIETPGLIDSLGPRRITRRRPEAGEVEIEIYAAALNFKDVAKAFNLLGDESLRDTWSGRLLGLECAGVVVARGVTVRSLQVGDAVIAQAPGCLASHITIDAHLVAHIPAHLTFEDAVTVPVAFVTADYALNDLARIQPGERILIHAASGGVGLAAIVFARLAGAEVFATAGSPEKRALLRLLGIEHVMDSRSLDFAREVLQRTAGRGVDVVLNSLGGPALARSLSVLAPGGRFLELGKRDIEKNARLPLQPFQKHLTFFAIDLDRLWAEQPDLTRTAFARVMRLFQEGVISPLPFRAFPVFQVQDAFRCMARARHIGKVVVALRRAVSPTRERGRSNLSLARRANLRFDQGCYLIAGGLGGFGLATARWLVEQGARCLALVSRAGASTEKAREAVLELERAGARVSVVCADICQAAQLGRVLADIRQTMPPLRGVFHAAMVQDEALLVQLDGEHFDNVMAPKVTGAWNLHRLTAADALDYFVLFSSVTSLFGSVGLSSYAAANSFLDSLAHWRRAQGLAGLSVNWTAVADVGYLANRQEVRASFEKMGFSPLSSRLMLRALGILLQNNAVQTAIMRLDWSKRAPNILSAISPFYSRLTSGKEAVVPGPMAPWEGQTVIGRREILITHLREQVGKTLGIAPVHLDPDLPLTSMGLESLMAVDLRHRVRTELGIDISILKLLGGITLNHWLHDILVHEHSP